MGITQNLNPAGGDYRYGGAATQGDGTGITQNLKPVVESGKAPSGFGWVDNGKTVSDDDGDVDGDGDGGGDGDGDGDGGPDGDGVVGGDGGGGDPPDRWANYSDEEKAAGIWAEQAFGGDVGAAIAHLVSLQGKIQGGTRLTPEDLAGIPPHFLAVLQQTQQAVDDAAGELYGGYRGGGREGMGVTGDPTDLALQEQEEVRKTWYGAAQGGTLSAEETTILMDASNRLNSEYAQFLKRVDADPANWQSLAGEFSAQSYSDPSAMAGITPETYRRVNQLKRGLMDKLKQRGLEASGTVSTQLIKDSAESLHRGTSLNAESLAGLPQGAQQAYAQYVAEVENDKQKEADWVTSGDAPPFQGNWVKNGDWWENHQSQNAGGGFFGVRINARTGMARGRFGREYYPFRHQTVERFQQSAKAAVDAEAARVAETQIGDDGAADKYAQGEVEYNQRLRDLEARIRNGDEITADDFAGIKNDDVFKLNDLTSRMGAITTAGDNFTTATDQFAALMERLKAGEQITQADTEGLSAEQINALSDVTSQPRSGAFYDLVGVAQRTGQVSEEQIAGLPPEEQDAIRKIAQSYATRMGIGGTGAATTPTGGPLGLDNTGGYDEAAGAQGDGTGITPNVGAQGDGTGGYGEAADAQGDGTGITPNVDETQETLQSLRDQLTNLRAQMEYQRTQGAQGQSRQRMGEELFNRAEELPESLRLAEEAAISRLKDGEDPELIRQTEQALETQIKEIERQAIAQGLTWSGARQNALGRTVEDISRSAMQQSRAEQDRAIQQAASLGQQVFQTKQAQRTFALSEAQVTGFYKDQPIMQMLMQQNEHNQQQMMAAGFTYTDPVTKEQRRVLGTDERRDQDWMRSEGVRVGYNKIEMDQNGNPLMDPYGEPIMRRVMGTQELQGFVQKEEIRLREKGLDAEEARFGAEMAWNKKLETGFWAAGEKGPIWIEGNSGMEKAKMQLQRDLQEAGFDQETSERIAVQANEKKIAGGYYTMGPDGNPQWVRGTQDFSEYMQTLQNDFQMTEREAREKWEEDQRVGYDRQVEVGKDPYGEPIYRKVHITGTQEFASTEADRQWANEEKKRVGYWKNEVQYDPYGEVIGEKAVWQPGTENHQTKIQNDAQTHDISVQQAQFAHSAAMEDKRILQDKWKQYRVESLTKEGWTEEAAQAEAQREWQTGQNDLDRTLEELLVDKRLQAEQSRFDAEGHRDLMNQSIGAIGQIGLDNGAGILKYLFGDNSNGLSPEGWTRDGLISSGVPEGQVDNFLSMGNKFLADAGRPAGDGWKWVTDTSELPNGGWMNGNSNQMYDPATGMAWDLGLKTHQKKAAEMGIMTGEQTVGVLNKFGNWLTFDKAGTGALGGAVGLAAAGVIAYGAYKVGNKVVDWWKNKKRKRQEMKNEGRSAYDEFYKEVPVAVQEEFDEIWASHGLDSEDDARWKFEELISALGDEQIQGMSELQFDGSDALNMFVIRGAEGGPLSQAVNKIVEGLSKDKRQKWWDITRQLVDKDREGNLNVGRTATVGTQMRIILDAGVEGKPLNEWSRSQRDAALEAWRHIPGASRTADATNEQKVRDLAIFGSEMNLMSSDEIVSTTRDLMSRVTNIDHLTVGDETLLNQIVGQLNGADVPFERRVEWLRGKNDEWSREYTATNSGGGMGVNVGYGYGG